MSLGKKQLKERPIIFSGPMIRAILDGKKTQTRRVIKPQPESGAIPILSVDPQYQGWEFVDRNCIVLLRPRCPYGVPSDRLWVRETWFPMQDVEACAMADEPIDIAYKADYDAEGISREEARDVGIDRWRPSIFMPRWASRIMLEIADVRVERIQSITRNDAIAEGVDWRKCPQVPDISFYKAAVTKIDYVAGFHSLWDSLNAKQGYGWDTNPWVWVITFRGVGLND